MIMVSYIGIHFEAPSILYGKNELSVYNGDQMVSYNGQSCVYDVMGNPTTYRGFFSMK